MLSPYAFHEMSVSLGDTTVFAYRLCEKPSHVGHYCLCRPLYANNINGVRAYGDLPLEFINEISIPQDHHLSSFLFKRIIQMITGITLSWCASSVFDICSKCKLLNLQYDDVLVNDDQGKTQVFSEPLVDSASVFGRHFKRVERC